MLYLASQSPQRAFLLNRAHISFTVVASRCDEQTIQHTNPQILALERARGKTLAAILSNDQVSPGKAVVLGADTVVALGSQILGKPADRADAVRILTHLSGSTHSVFTGHCCAVINADGSVACQAARIAMAKVTMRPLSPDDIRAYVDSGESDGRAGAYAIQETGDRFVVDVQGGWDTVVGLNVAMAARLYQECTDKTLPGYLPGQSGGCRS